MFPMVNYYGEITLEMGSFGKIVRHDFSSINKLNTVGLVLQVSRLITQITYIMFVYPLRGRGLWKTSEISSKVFQYVR
jgi:hypothetical protein